MSSKSCKRFDGFQIFGEEFDSSVRMHFRIPYIGKLYINGVLDRPRNKLRYICWSDVELRYGK